MSKRLALRLPGTFVRMASSGIITCRQRCEPMPNMISEDELLRFLSQVENGSVRLMPEDEPQAVYAGNVRYAASNGWTLVVFNDANEWDYIDSVEAADGRKLDFDALDAMPGVRLYTPTE